MDNYKIRIINKKTTDLKISRMFIYSPLYYIGTLIKGSNVPDLRLDEKAFSVEGRGDKK